MGERQLLSFARAVVRDPDLLVLDEEERLAGVIAQFRDQPFFGLT